MGDYSKVNNLFIFANSYITNTLVKCIRDMVNFKIDDIVLIKENYPDIIEENIILCDTLEKAITISSTIVVVIDDNIPTGSIAMIKELALIYNVKCYVVKNQWEDGILPDNSSNYCNLEFRNNLPNILNISFGPATQQPIGEMMLRKIMINNNIKYVQVYSAKTRRFFEELKKHSILNNEIKNQLEASSEAEIQIISIDLGSNFNQGKEYFEQIRRNEPDFVIFQSNINAPGREKIESNLRIINADREIFCITSNYYETFSKIKVFISNINKADKKYHSIYSSNLIETLSNSIFSQLAYPAGIVTL